MTTTTTTSSGLASTASVAAVSTLPAIGMVVLALSVLPVSDTIGKYLTATLPVLQVVWARYFFHLAATAPMALAAGHGRRALSPGIAVRQLVRGLFLAASTICFFFGLRRLPLADSIAVLFVAPLIVTGLAPFVLGERVGWRRYAAVAVGFVGALIIIRPGGETGWYALFPLASGFSYAFYLLATRRLAGSAPPIVTLAYTAVVGTIVLSAMMPFVWRWPSPFEMVLMVMMGPIGATGHYLIIRAHERASASLLAPFQYWQIVASMALGFIVFHQFPDRWTLFGAAVLITSGLYVWLRERALIRASSFESAAGSAAA